MTDQSKKRYKPTHKKEEKMKKWLYSATAALLAFSLFTIPAYADEGVFVLDPFGSTTFTANEDDEHLNFNFKDSGGAWANIMNPWGDSAYLIFMPSVGFVQSFVITFEVEGYDGGDEGYRTMCGFGINGWSPSVWSLDEGMDDGINWEQIFGRQHNFVIDGDGVYQMIVSLRAAMDYFEAENDWYIKDFLEGVDCIELGIYGVPEDSTMMVTILDIIETADIFSFDNIQRPLGSGLFFAATVDELPPLPTPEPPHVPRIGADGELINGGNGDDNAVESEPEPEPEPEPAPAPEPVEMPTVEPIAPLDDSSSDGGDTWWIWLAGGVLAVGLAVLLIIKRKKG
jgi:hypothetical protein